jgi:sterol 14-demethylase
MCIRQKLYEEQQAILGDKFEQQMTYESLKDMDLLDRCIKETLRLRPPIITLFRKVSPLSPSLQRPYFFF